MASWKERVPLLLGGGLSSAAALEVAAGFRASLAEGAAVAAVVDAAAAAEDEDDDAAAAGRMVVLLRKLRGARDWTREREEEVRVESERSSRLAWFGRRKRRLVFFFLLRHSPIFRSPPFSIARFESLAVLIRSIWTAMQQEKSRKKPTHRWDIGLRLAAVVKGDDDDDEGQSKRRIAPPPVVALIVGETRCLIASMARREARSINDARGRGAQAPALSRKS